MSPVLSRTDSGYSNLVFPSVLWDRWSPTAKVPYPQNMCVGVLVRLLTHTDAQHVLCACMSSSPLQSQVW